MCKTGTYSSELLTRPEWICELRLNEKTIKTQREDRAAGQLAEKMLEGSNKKLKPLTSGICSNCCE